LCSYHSPVKRSPPIKEDALSTVPGPDDRNICKIIAAKETKPHTYFIWVFIAAMAIQVIFILMYLDSLVRYKLIAAALCYGAHRMMFNYLKNNFLLAIKDDDTYSYALGGRLTNAWSTFSMILVLIAVFRFW
jgi:hypothetical protein